MKPEKIFLIFSLFFGFLFAFLLPPFQVFDESGHFFRAYQVSTGRLVAQKEEGRAGGSLPRSLWTLASLFEDMRFQYGKKFDRSLLEQGLEIRLQREDSTFLDFPHTALHPPVGYGPQALGLLLGRWLGLRPLVLMYLGRIVNLLAWTALAFLAIRLTPVSKKSFLLLALMPAALYEAASLAADAMTNGLAFLLIALGLKYAFSESVLSRKQLALFLALSALMAFSKYSYFFVPLLFFLIPVRRLGSRRRYLAYGGALVLILGICALLWSKVIQDLYVPMRAGTDAFRQMNFIREDPWRYLGILANTYRLFWKHMLVQLVAAFGWDAVPLPLLWTAFYLLVALYASITEREAGLDFSAWQRLLMLACLVGTVLMISTSIYLDWTPLGQGSVDWIAGRYFIPLSPMALLLLHNGTAVLSRRPRGFTAFLLGVLAVTYFLSVHTILHRFYIPGASPIRSLG